MSGSGPAERARRDVADARAAIERKQLMWRSGVWLRAMVIHLADHCDALAADNERLRAVALMIVDEGFLPPSIEYELREALGS